MRVNKVIVKAGKKKKYAILHDRDITPPISSDQLLTTLKHQFDVLSFTVEDGVATAIVGKKQDEVT